MAGDNHIMQSTLVSEGQTCFLSFVISRFYTDKYMHVKHTCDTKVEVEMSRRTKGTNRSRVGRWEICLRNTTCMKAVLVIHYHVQWMHINGHKYIKSKIS